MDAYIIILMGVAFIVFRKQITALQNRTQFGIPKFIKKRVSESTVESTKKKVVTYQEIFGIITGVLGIIVGILVKLGILHMRQ